MSKRLAELEPEWILADGRKIGLKFLCPINDGAGPHYEGHTIAVLFANPPDGGPAHPDDYGVVGNNGGKRWVISAAGQAVDIVLELLSLSPSIDCTRGEGCSKNDHTTCSHTHCWHGMLSNGVIS
jgi:hypothetical protein